MSVYRKTKTVTVIEGGEEDEGVHVPNVEEALEKEEVVTTESLSYEFKPIEKKWECQSSIELCEAWKRWDLSQYSTLTAFAITAGRFDPSASDSFLLDLFNSPDVRSALVLHTKRGSTRLSARARKINYKVLHTSVLNRKDFFDRLIESGILFSTGGIRRRADIDINGVMVGDWLRSTVLDVYNEVEDYSNSFQIKYEKIDQSKKLEYKNPSVDNPFIFSKPGAPKLSEPNCIYSFEERRELLYILLKRILIGGPSFQQDDLYESYFDVAVRLYRDLCVICKNTEESAPFINSNVYLIESIDFDGSDSLFPSSSNDDHNMCVVAVDSLTRVVNIVHVPFISFW